MKAKRTKSTLTPEVANTLRQAVADAETVSAYLGRTADAYAALSGASAEVLKAITLTKLFLAHDAGTLRKQHPAVFAVEAKTNGK